MKKLKYLAKDFSTVYRNEMYNFDHALNLMDYEAGFQTGFKEAFGFIKTYIDEEKATLDQYPMMSERKAAMTKMQLKLEDILKKMTDEKA